MAITYIPYDPATDPMQYLNQALQQYSGVRGRRKDIQALTQYAQYQQKIREAETLGQAPPAFQQFPQLRSPQMQQMTGQTLIRNLLAPQLQPTLSPTQQIAERKLAMINRLEAIPQKQRTKVQQAKLDKMLIGQPLVEIGFGKPAAAAERTAIAETRASIDALNNLKSLYKEEFIGPITGRIAPTAGLLGKTTEQQESFMAATSAFKNAIIKEITGAQMSEPEAKRIMKQIPDITDPPTRWKAKWEQSKKNLEFLQKRRLEILQQSGLRVPIGETTITIPPEIHNMSDEELRRIAGIE